MGYYRFFQTSEESVWTPIQDGPNVVEQAKKNGAKKLTIMAVDKPLAGDDAARGNSYKGPLYFDIDNDEGDVTEAIKSSLELLNKLTETYAVPLEAISIFLSGKKGLHILVDQKAFMPRRSGIKDLPLIYKIMATNLYVTGLDLSPYSVGKNNTFRIANLKRHDGNYRVPIRFHELQTLDAAGYSLLVSKPRPEISVLPYDNGEYSISLQVMFAKASEQFARQEKELTDRSRLLPNGALEKISDTAPPCVVELSTQKRLAGTASFNDVALNLGIWAARAKVPEHERNRIFALTADNATPSDRYPNSRARIQELEGKFRFATHSTEYKFGCGAMRSLLKDGRKVCDGCPLEKSCSTTSVAEYFNDMAERLGVVANEAGYLKLHGKGKTEPISTFTLRAEAKYMEDQPDGTGFRRRGTLCRVMRNGEQLATVILNEESWASKSAFLRAIEGLSGVYYTGGDAEVQKIKMLVFIEEEDMPEINQVTAAGIHIDRSRATDVITYVEPGKSVNSLHMVDTHRLTKRINLPPALFKERPLAAGDVEVDQTLANFLRSNDSASLAVIVGWFVACHLKAHIRLLHSQFPLLSLWGAAGSGKSRVGEFMANIHGLDCSENSKTSCPALTRFNAIELLSSTTTIPRLCEEYNKDKMPEHQYVMLGEMFKALFNTESAPRGTVVAGAKSPFSVEIALTAPVVFMSEQQIKMPALRERSLVIMLNKKHRNRAPFLKAWGTRSSLKRLGQHLMQATLKMSTAKVQKMLEDELPNIGDQWDDRPAFNLQVVHMALTWLQNICSVMRMPDSARELSKAKQALLAITRQPDEEATEHHFLSRGHENSEIDLFLIRIGDMAVESGSVMAEHMTNRQPMPTGRRIWLNPRHDYKIAGDTLYLVSKACHARYVEWNRTMGQRIPLSDWSDLKNLIEHEPYFMGWEKLNDFGFGEPVVKISMTELARKGVDLSALRNVYDTLGKIELEVSG